MATLPDRIASTALASFAALPKKRKPQTRADGSTEWVPLAAVVLEDITDGSLKCVALGTGMKALAAAKLPDAKGLVLHDWHAEVIAIRAFNRWIISQCTPHSHYLLQLSPSDLYTLHPRFRIHFYCSEAPCGDASMELTMSSQVDANPWTLPPGQQHFRGRGYFSHLGIVRTKPGRADSPITLSKSCSDKLSLRCGVSLLLTPTAYLVSPENVYISTLVLPDSQYSTVACERAFSDSGRLKELVGRDWGDGYRFRGFEVRTTTMEFAYSRRVVGPAGSNAACVLVDGVGEETLIGGVLQGRKQSDGIKAGSIICRQRFWEAIGSQGCSRYSELKSSAAMEARRQMKDDVRQALVGWTQNEGDDHFFWPFGAVVVAVGVGGSFFGRESRMD